MDYSLQNKIERRLRQLKRDNIKFIAPTIAPANSSVEEKNLESLKAALEYFASHGVEQLEAQIKWMGSRGNVYLFADDITKSFLVSRNGFVIRYGSDRLPGNEKCFTHWHKKMFSKTNPFGMCLKSAILDAEVLPWAAMGTGLINKKFVAFGEAVNSELAFLKEHGFEEAKNAFVSSDAFNEYLSLDEKAKKGHMMRESASNIQENVMNSLTIEQQEADMAAYEKSLSNFIQTDVPTTFAAFDILRLEYEDGSVNVDDGFMGNVRLKTHFLNQRQEKYVMDIREKSFLADGRINLASALFPLFDPSKPETYDSLKLIMEAVSAHKLEGIVLKPLTPGKTTAVPAMKVRDPDYLRIIYGPHYMTENPMHLIETKRTGRKRKISHSEHKLANEMLKLDESSPTYNADYERIVKAILFEIEEENTVDGRL